MQPFAYLRPASLAEAVAVLDERGPDARVLAGGTDLVIRLRDGSVAPSLVVDVKRIPELAPGIRAEGDRLVIGATTVMSDIAAHPVIRREAAALAEAAAVVGSAQIRNRATLGGNLCNASPAADTAPPLLVHGAVVVVAGSNGTRRFPLDDLFVRSGVTTLARGELLLAVELPIPAERVASAHQRRTRRRGHDLASVTLSCGVDRSGVVRIAYGSVGPRPLLRVDTTGTLADTGAPPEARAAILEAMFADASPSPRSMRAGPAYRLAMLRVLGRRALATALERLGRGDVA
jgi:CO/xanthine dehydrogenase FAD-binding subunit